MNDDYREIPDEVIDSIKKSYNDYLAKSRNPKKLTFEEFALSIYESGKIKIKMEIARDEIKSKYQEIRNLEKNIEYYETKLKEIQEQLI